MQSLPPLDALIAFEAAARLGSMTQAAGELGVTQSAVSHRVRRLEEYMKTKLLLRGHARLSLTPAGDAILSDLPDVLDQLSNLKSRCLSAAAPGRLRVGVGPALADNWLVRRLPKFFAEFPTISIELVIVENEMPERVADLDFRILWVPIEEIRSTSTQRPLFQEHVFPVCHPSLLPDSFEPGDVSILTTMPLLHKGPADSNTSVEWSWQSWFTRLGVTQPPRETIRFASIGPAISAALEGNGAVLGRSMLVNDAIADGRLVRLLPPEYDLLSDKAHIIRWPAAFREEPKVRQFSKWLVAQANEAMLNL